MAWQWFSLGSRARMLIAGGVIVLLAVGLRIWQHHTDLASPDEGGRVITNLPERATRVVSREENRPAPAGATYNASGTAAAGRVKVPAVADLQRGVPQLVPGLEPYDRTSSISLSSDLCTIVFNGPGPGERASVRLYIAQRASVTEPFRNAHMVASCASWTMGRFTLSPDGLELIFPPAPNAPTQFLCCRRDSTLAEFGEPVRLPPWDMPVQQSQFTMARFLDSLHVLVSIENPGPQPQSASFYIVERAAVDASFGPPKEFFVGGLGGKACLSPDWLQAYSGNNDGIFVRRRSSEEEPFGKLVRHVAPNVCGAVNAPSVWVAPGGDVLFYTSPGPRKPKGAGYIWMLRL
jgi:hypothetical protein